MPPFALSLSKGATRFSLFVMAGRYFYRWAAGPTNKTHSLPGQVPAYATTKL